LTTPDTDGAIAHRYPGAPRHCLDHRRWSRGPWSSGRAWHDLRRALAP